MTWERRNLQTATAGSVTWVLQNSINPIRDFQVAAEVPSPDYYTDVIYEDENYTTYCGFAWHGSGGGVIGHARCLNRSGLSCESFSVKLDTSWMDSVDFLWRRHLLCHETGHTLGLSHRAHVAADTGCMPATTSNGPFSNLSDHDINHVNAYFS